MTDQKRGINSDDLHEERIRRALDRLNAAHQARQQAAEELAQLVRGRSAAQVAKMEEERGLR